MGVSVGCVLSFFSTSVSALLQPLCQPLCLRQYRCYILYSYRSMRQVQWLTSPPVRSELAKKRSPVRSDFAKKRHGPPVRSAFAKKRYRPPVRSAFAKKRYGLPVGSALQKKGTGRQSEVRLAKKRHGLPVGSALQKRVRRALAKKRYSPPVRSALAKKRCSPPVRSALAPKEGQLASHERFIQNEVQHPYPNTHQTWGLSSTI